MIDALYRELAYCTGPFLRVPRHQMCGFMGCEKRVPAGEEMCCTCAEELEAWMGR